MSQHTNAPKPPTVQAFRQAKAKGQKLSVVTCYDAWSAKTLNASDVDALLVGDSVAMVLHGHPNTLAATSEMMALHTAAVARGAPHKLLIGDMPFLSFRKGLGPAMESAELLMRAGAHALKLEGVDGHEDVVDALVKSGIPVMGHVGLTPQSLHGLGGFRVQGKDDAAAAEILRQAKRLEELGCFSIVLECVPTALGERLTSALSIPTIGIGAGPHCDGQVLVLHDLLGVDSSFRPRFVRRFADFEGGLREAVATYSRAVRDGSFPNAEESYA